MERSERIGMIVSGGAHFGAILWLLLGGIFFAHDMPPPVTTAEVSLMSQAEFDALRAAAPRATTEAPPQPSLPEPPASEPQPPAPEPQTPTPPAPTPEPQPEPDASPDVTDLSPPKAEVEDTPPTPPTPPSEQSATSDVVTPAPQPRPADIVAPDPTDAPDRPSDLAPDTVVDTTPDPHAEPKPEPLTEAAVSKATGDLLKTEENKDKVASAAPQASVRPKSKPAKPKPADATPTPTEPAAPATAAAPAPKDAVAEALAGAQADTPAPGTGTAPSGPPMTGGEKDALVVAVKQCWNVGSLSTDALNTVVTIGVTMEPSGRPVSGSIRMVGYEGGSEASAGLAYEAGRRAILRCARDGYPLPPEKYEQWKEVEITFDPDKMRMK